MMRTRKLALGLVCVLLSACSLVPHADNAGALADIARHDDGVEIVVEGPVLRVFPASTGPSGVHERFVMQVASAGASVPLFVADNISIAAAAPLRIGDIVLVKGELAFNDMGPVLHWTHRDPRFRHQPGFVEVGGRIYE